MMVFAQLTVAIYILADHPKCWGQGATKVSNDLGGEDGHWSNLTRMMTDRVQLYMQISGMGEGPKHIGSSCNMEEGPKY